MYQGIGSSSLTDGDDLKTFVEVGLKQHCTSSTIVQRCEKWFCLRQIGLTLSAYARTDLILYLPAVVANFNTTECTVYRNRNRTLVKRFTDIRDL